MFWTKIAHQSAVFQTFECFDESSTDSSCHFWNYKVRFYSSFASVFSVMKDNSLQMYSFVAQTLYTLNKRAHRKEIFRLLSGWVKIHQIPHVIFKTTNLGFFSNLASLLSVMRENSIELF